MTALHVLCPQFDNEVLGLVPAVGWCAHLRIRDQATRAAEELAAPVVAWALVRVVHLVERVTVEPVVVVNGEALNFSELRRRNHPDALVSCSLAPAEPLAAAS